MNQRIIGIRAALGSAFFLGLAPIFGKQAILLGMSWLAVVALRTIMAALLLLVVMYFFQRKYLFIYPAGLLGCILAGGINGVGSLLYYGALGRIDASVGQLLYAFYPLFVALWLALDHQPLSRLTTVRLILAIPGLYLLTQSGRGQVDFLGVVMMLGASALYALHLPINQRVLFEMPAPTVTLYTLISMSVVVAPAFLISCMLNDSFTIFAPGVLVSPDLKGALLALGGLTLVTFVSRLMLFLGVKHLGGMQTALLGLGELLVTVFLAHAWLGEQFSILQWVGMGVLTAGLGLVGLEKNPPRRALSGGWLSWLRPSGLPTDLPIRVHEQGNPGIIGAATIRSWIDDRK